VETAVDVVNRNLANLNEAFAAHPTEVPGKDTV
jgi:hypothetical protein